MILTDSIEADNNFAKAYNALTKGDKARVREIIMAGCGITEDTVREWIHEPSLVKSPLHRRYIAYLIFNKPIKDFFEK